MSSEEEQDYNTLLKELSDKLTRNEISVEEYGQMYGVMLMRQRIKVQLKYCCYRHSTTKK